MHYIPYSFRLQFLKNLQNKGLKIKYRDIKKAWKDTKIPIVYANLAIRKYLISHIRSKVKIFDDPEEQYQIVKQVLPQFHKQKMAKVYQDINARIRKQRQTKVKK